MGVAVSWNLRQCLQKVTFPCTERIIKFNYLKIGDWKVVKMRRWIFIEGFLFPVKLLLKSLKASTDRCICVFEFFVFVYLIEKLILYWRLSLPWNYYLNPSKLPPISQYLRIMQRLNINSTKPVSSYWKCSRI